MANPYLEDALKEFTKALTDIALGRNKVDISPNKTNELKHGFSIQVNRAVR